MQTIFNELNFIKVIKADIQAIFSTTAIYDVIGNEVNVYTSVNESTTSFPCIFARVLNNSSASRYATAEQGQQFSDITIEFDCYSVEFSDYTKDEAIIYISQELIQGFANKYPLAQMTFNQFMPNLDNLVARKTVRFNCTINNGTNYIYNN